MFVFLIQGGVGSSPISCGSLGLSDDFRKDVRSAEVVEGTQVRSMDRNDSEDGTHSF